MLHKYEIPEDQTEPSSLFITIVAEVVDELDNCRNTFLYIADGGASALIVYDLTKNTSWKIKHDSFKPDPNFSTYTIDGELYFV